MNILFVNACIRKESRTKRLAEQVIEKIKTAEDTVSEVYVADAVMPIKDESFILSRNNASSSKDFSNDVYAPAKQFADADLIVVGTPYWDLSFPAILKAYFEQINVLGLTFEYAADGTPRGLCKAQKLIYVTTAGGPIISDEYGYGYVKTMAQAFYGISDVKQIKAEGLDIFGADIDSILNDAIKNISSCL